MTLLFSDIEGSTKLVARLGKRYADTLSGHRAVLREVWAAYRGFEMGTEGDSFYVAFGVARHATRAAMKAQLDLASLSWPDDARPRVRIGLHTGEPLVHEGAYVGEDVHRAARIGAVAHGGQIVISQATRDLVARWLPAGAQLVDLGRHRLKDLAEPEHLYQLNPPGLEEHFPPLKSLGAVTKLPASPTPLVGRDREVEELGDLIRTPGVRFVTLTGTAGAGKTRLATAVARELISTFEDGVYFVSLAAVTSGEAMWSTLAESLGLTGEKTVKTQVLAYLRDRSLLLIADNLEQIPDASNVVREVLSAGRRLVVLATSRRPLHLHSEHEYPVAPLDLPTSSSLQSIARSGAVRLFRDCARLVVPRFSLTAANAPHVGAICQRLDGLPLAIELAAMRTKILSPAAILIRLDHTSGLSGEELDRPQRQRTLYEAIGWSYRLLDSDLQAFFRRLGVFAGGADLAAVSAVASRRRDPLARIERLVDVSLATVTQTPEGEPRVFLLQTIADFAREELVRTGEESLARVRHARYYLSLAERAFGHYGTGHHQAARDRLDADHDNIRSALAWAFASESGADPSPEKVALGQQLCAELWPYWADYGHIVEGRRWLERAVALATDRIEPQAAEVFRGLGAVLDMQGELHRARMLFKRSVDIWRHLGRTDQLAPAMSDLGRMDHYLGDLEAARRTIGESVFWARRAGDEVALSIGLASLGELESDAGNLRTALALLDEAAAHCTGRSGSAAIHAANSVPILLRMGRVAEGRARLEKINAQVLAERNTGLTIAFVEAVVGLHAVEGRPRMAATYLGALEGVRKHTGVPALPSETAELEQILRPVRKKISPAEWERSRSSGRRLTVADVVDHALDPLE